MKNTYVALLRGINVGGNNIIKMSPLSEEFTKLGFANVRTFIQSGNVIFESKVLDKTKLEDKIERALSQAFNYKSRVLIRSKEDMGNIILQYPKIFKDKSWKHNIIFLGDNLNHPEIVDKFSPVKGLEEIHYVNGVIFWSAVLDMITTKSSMMKLSAKDEYKQMTVRNVATTKKIYELMS